MSEDAKQVFGRRVAIRPKHPHEAVGRDAGRRAAFAALHVNNIVPYSNAFIHSSNSAVSGDSTAISSPVEG